MRSNIWMLNVMESFLVTNLKATTDEIDYVKRLVTVRSQPRGDSAKRPGPSKPSTIIDNFLYHGDIGHANNQKLLEEIGVTHIVSACDIKLNKEITDKFNVLWINIDDGLSCDIRQYFDRTNDFLHKCKQKNERVLVHCQMGISRSSSIVLAYLLKYQYDNLYDAYLHLLECRRIAAPNFGFFIQLIRYENDLKYSDKPID